MKRLSKLLILILALALAVSLACVAVFATDGGAGGEGSEGGEGGSIPAPVLPTEDAPLVEGAIFEVIASNGKRRSSGVTDVEFKAAVEQYFDGDTVILLNNLYIVPRDKDGNEVADSSVRDNQEDLSWANLKIYNLDGHTLNLDLNGFGIVQKSDNWINSNRYHTSVFDIGAETKLNLYSSRPGAFIFASSTEWGVTSTYYTSGFAFSIADNCRVNIGKFTKPDGTVAEGSNLSTSAAGFINFGTSKATVNVDGGTYYRYNTGSQVGIVAQREGSDSTLTVKNANLISYGASKGSFMIRGQKSTTIFDNCLIYVVKGEGTDMVLNDGGGVRGKEYYRFTGKMVLKDCVLNYTLSAVSQYPPETNAGFIGQLHLEGETVFLDKAVTKEIEDSYKIYKDGYTQSVEGGTEFFPDVYKGLFEEGYTLARVSRKLEVAGNPIMYIPGFDDGIYESVSEHQMKVINMSESESFIARNENFYGYAFVPNDQIEYYKYVDAGGTPYDTYWKLGQEVSAPAGVALPKDKLEGVWKYGWVTEKTGDKSYTVRVAPMADFDVRVSYELYPEFAVNVYVPKDVFTEYVNPIDVMIGGNYIAAGVGKDVTINVDGKDVTYVKLSSKIDTAEKLLDTLEISIPISYWNSDKGVRIEGSGKWSVDILSYRDAIYADGSGCTDAERKMMNELLNYIMKSYELNVPEESFNQELYNELITRVDTSALVNDSTDFKAAIGTAGTCTLADGLIGTVTVDKAKAELKIKLKSDFTGKLKLEAAGGAKIYEITDGKWEGKDEITVRMAPLGMFECLKVSVLTGRGKVILGADAADAQEGISGRISTLPTDIAASELKQAYYAFLYSVKLAEIN